MRTVTGRSAQKSGDCEKGCDGGQDGAQTRSPAASQTVFPVLADAACIRHDVGDVVLLMDAVQQVSQGTFSKHSHILSSVSLHAQRYSWLRLVVVFLWKEILLFLTPERLSGKIHPKSKVPWWVFALKLQLRSIFLWVGPRFVYLMHEDAHARCDTQSCQWFHAFLLIYRWQ